MISFFPLGSRFLFLSFTVLYEVRVDKFHQPQNFNLRPSTKQDS
jgi:hypothetical protein